MQSGCTGSDQSIEFDIIASNKDFIEKMGQRWMQSTTYFSNAQKMSNKVNDSLDVCNYRAIKNYAVNKVSNFACGAAINENIDFDLSGLDGNGYIFDQSINDMAIVNMEDTLDVCSYRRPVHRNVPNIRDESTLVYHDTIADLSFNKSTADGQHMNQLDETTIKMEDTLDVCNYRHQHAPSQSLTPVQYNTWMSSHFNKCLVPFALFSPSPIPMTSSPIANNSAFVAPFSDQSDDNINSSSE